VIDVKSASEDETITSSTISKTDLSLNKNFISTKQNQKFLTSYVSYSLSSKDKEHFENLILCMIVSNCLSFIFMKNQKTQDVFNYIAPVLKLSNRHAINKIGVIAVFNGWMNIKQKHLFGIVLITSQGKALHQLRVEYPNKVFMPYMAHQMNLVFSDIFKVSDIFNASSKKTICIKKHSEVKKDKQQYKQIHAITFIQQELTESFSFKSNNIENKLLDSNNSLTQLSKTLEMNDNVVDNIEENWLCIVENLIGLLNSKNQLNNSEIVDSEPLEFELHKHITYPVDNLSAKW
ncbi:10611_t:CDS:2, partial [Cetraspora pellucida]